MVHAQTFLVVKLDDDADWSKDLFSYDFHVRLGVGEDGGLDKVAFGSVPLATDENIGTICLARFDVTHDSLGTPS